ncbi:GuaB3 family IMP dehydrogenase-related protein [Frankia sp. AgB1.9]|uniref:GuaB3 family IMP dehydrogenase-related protein n=1 Tax=unclassified Frankia TaxID=2632575 RepID=UPI0019316E73|nr:MULTISPECIES: GuaB3 family IMP dehydrogenase-related protein [unclassified Frankia]MBL7490103.1 GuaB3 family IMP dehydrogenase-related protein [Frankia sp. AgW1.1]MBL7551449.1 GuaB3 family IMP dehydrogenase-related protein [Frankia sp. AgB1.9]MBL7617785.1 GuaB3 family IMP dehydrogenase-related protein [Frankia sp. AgB1.8]
MAEVEIGIGKSARVGYDLAAVGIVPSRRTRDPADVSLAWQVDAYHFDLPIVAAAADAVSSPDSAITVGKLGGLGVLHVEGLWTRHEDPLPLVAELAGLPAGAATSRLRELYRAPIRPELIAERVGQVRDAGLVTAAALRPQKVRALSADLLAAQVDLLVIHGPAVSAEHQSTRTEPLNLKRFIGDLDMPVLVGGCASFSTALHLMRTGAAGVIVGVGTGGGDANRAELGIGVPLATAIADAAGARMRYLDESGGRYVHVIAHGDLRTGGDIAKAVACGADAVMVDGVLAGATDAPGHGGMWSMDVLHSDLPRGGWQPVEQAGTLEQILVGPDQGGAASTVSLAGALRAAMATTGYASLKEFQKAEIMLSAAAGQWSR